MPRNKTQQHVNLSRTTTAKRVCLYLFPVSISFPFPAFPYAHKDVRVLICFETPNGVHNRLLNFSRQIEALAPAIRSH